MIIDVFENVEKYKVICSSGVYEVKADCWSIGNEGLKFYKKERIIAWFTSWESWMWIEE